jgi:hypothetical protein
MSGLPQQELNSLVSFLKTELSMPKTYDAEYLIEAIEVPDYLVHLVMDTPRLLPGERAEDFILAFEAMVGELLPHFDLEWLLCIDLAWILWDIQRYRRWKTAIMVMNQRPALEERCAVAISCTS